MNILALSFSLSTSSLDIFLAGCAGPHCENCHNPGSWAFDQGRPWRSRMTEIGNKLRVNQWIVKNIFIMGGEPLDQEVSELQAFLQELQMAIVEQKIWLFTGKDLVEVPLAVIPYLDFLKTGRHIPALSPGTLRHGVQLSSSNQKIYAL